MKSFEELVAYQRARELRRLVYEITERYPADERFGMTQQIRRASLSVMRHIAEGQGRLSDGEWRQFLSQARGSLYEVQSEVISAKDLGFVDEQQYVQLIRAIKRTASPLNGLIKYVVKCEKSKRTRSVTT